MCRWTSRFALQNVLSEQPLPEFTETWVAGLARGTFPIFPAILLISALLAAVGLFFVFSGKPSPQARTTGLVAVCSLGFTIASMTLGSTMIALVLPFIKTL